MNFMVIQLSTLPKSWILWLCNFLPYQNHEFHGYTTFYPTKIMNFVVMQLSTLPKSWISWLCKFLNCLVTSHFLPQTFSSALYSHANLFRICCTKCVLHCCNTINRTTLVTFALYILPIKSLLLKIIKVYVSWSRTFRSLRLKISFTSAQLSPVHKAVRNFWTRFKFWDL